MFLGLVVDCALLASGFIVPKTLSLRERQRKNSHSDRYITAGPSVFTFSGALVFSVLGIEINRFLLIYITF